MPRWCLICRPMIRDGLHTCRVWSLDSCLPVLVKGSVCCPILRLPLSLVKTCFYSWYKGFVSKLHLVSFSMDFLYTQDHSTLHLKRNNQRHGLAIFPIEGPWILFINTMWPELWVPNACAVFEETYCPQIPACFLQDQIQPPPFCNIGGPVSKHSLWGLSVCLWRLE